MFAFIMAAAQPDHGSGVGDTVGKNLFDTIQPFVWWIALAIFIVGLLGHFGQKQVQRMVVLAGVLVVVAIPVLDPTGFGDMIGSVVNQITKGL